MSSSTHQFPSRPRTSNPYTPVQVSQKPGLLNGIGSTVQKGMAFGPGSERTHSIISRQSDNINSFAQNPCQGEFSNFETCLGINSD